MASDEKPITVSIVPLQKAANARGVDRRAMMDSAMGHGVLIDSTNFEHRAIFGIDQYYVPESWARDADMPDEEG